MSVDSGLSHLFLGLPEIASGETSQIRFSVSPIEGSNHFLGKSAKGQPAILLASSIPDSIIIPPIALENISVVFNVSCDFLLNGTRNNARVTLVECLSENNETQQLFLHISEKVLAVLGACPTHTEVSNAINRLVLLFRKLSQPPTRNVMGLLGELLIITLSRNPIIAIKAWRGDDSDRYDFSWEEARIEVKTSAARTRIHEFSREQCMPPEGSSSIVASIFLERAGGGTSLNECIQRIEERVSEDSEAVLKLHTVVAETLGENIQSAMNYRFDEQLAVSSLQFFWLDEIPAIRKKVPPGVSKIRFLSDLESISPCELSDIETRSDTLNELVPQAIGGL